MEQIEGFPSGHDVACQSKPNTVAETGSISLFKAAQRTDGWCKSADQNKANSPPSSDDESSVAA